MQTQELLRNRASLNAPLHYKVGGTNTSSYGTSLIFDSKKQCSLTNLLAVKDVKDSFNDQATAHERADRIQGKTPKPILCKPALLERLRCKGACLTRPLWAWNMPFGCSLGICASRHTVCRAASLWSTLLASGCFCHTCCCCCCCCCTSTC